MGWLRILTDFRPSAHCADVTSHDKANLHPVFIWEIGAVYEVERHMLTANTSTYAGLTIPRILKQRVFTLYMLATDRVSAIFADARSLHADALRLLEAGDIRDAAEKAWCATKRATDALIISAHGRSTPSFPRIPLEACSGWLKQTARSIL